MTHSASSPEPSPPRAWWLDVGIVVLLCGVCAGVFANGVHGDFVYDDVRQIQQNRLIADPALLWRALVSDVWAFKGDRGSSWSNYWRPTFVLYLVLNQRLFGTEDPLGWHVMNVSLHAVVVTLGYGLLRSLGASRALAAAVALLFAVHPVHVESVTWISGSPDLLVAIGTLGALGCVMSDYRRPRRRTKFGGLALYAFAQLAKESAVLFPALVFATVFLLDPGFTQRRLKRAAKATVPFAALTLLYLIAHHRIAPPIDVAWDPGLGGILRTAPLVLSFYLRQALLPVWIGPAYPLRALGPDDLDWLNFTVPLAVAIAGGAGLLYAARRDPVRQVGLLLFALLLAPAFYLRAFRHEEIVHDRYLYLPLLGLLAALLPTLATAVTHWLPRSGPRVLTASVCIVAALLAVQTVRCNRTWSSAETLWTRAVESAPNAAHAWSELANVHYRRPASTPAERQARANDAKRCVDRALELYPATQAFLLRGVIARDERRFDDAVADFERILAHHPEHVLAYENLAVCHDAAGHTEAAIAALERARAKVPYRYATWTEKIAVCYYRLGRQDDVVRELEEARPRVAQEYRLVPEASLVLYRLASIRAARGETQLARDAATEFLRLTADTSHPGIQRRRAETETLLETVPAFDATAPSQK
ncbi:MAG: tetratricopeptide repeat protein [Planctomycetota bacterium]